MNTIQKLENLRLKYRKSKANFAKAANISQQTYYNWINHKGEPAYSHVYLILNSLSISIQWTIEP